MSAAFIKQIERNINTKMVGIKNREITPKDSKIGVQFKKLKEMDEASYEKLILKYKKLLSTL
jgi:hypothetical protein